MKISGLRYKIKNFEKRELDLCNKGCIEAHLKGNLLYPWKRKIVEYYVTVKRFDENFDRILVFTESEFNTLFPLNKRSPY